MRHAIGVKRQTELLQIIHQINCLSYVQSFWHCMLVCSVDMFWEFQPVDNQSRMFLPVHANRRHGFRSRANLLLIRFTVPLV
jgi:hypothetical protein